MKRESRHSEKRKTIILIIGCWLLVGLTGCDAFVRKFTRKPKKENLPQEEMVVAPVEYQAPVMTNQDLYRQYFLYWKSWQDELIDALMPKANRKKQIDCAEQAVSNLEQLRLLLDEARQKKLDIQINQLKYLKDSITKDIYGDKFSSARATAEQAKRNILRDFSYQKIKDYLK